MTAILLGPSDNEEDSLELQTRKKRPIRNEFRPRDNHPDTLEAAVGFFSETNPDAQLLFSSALYNCGGLVFGSRRVWIDPEDFREILDDDGYESVSEHRPGDVVLYGRSAESIDHVGVTRPLRCRHTPSRRFGCAPNGGMPESMFMRSTMYRNSSVGRSRY